MQRTASGKPRSPRLLKPPSSRARYVPRHAKSTLTKISMWFPVIARPMNKPRGRFCLSPIRSRKLKRFMRTRLKRCTRNSMPRRARSAKLTSTAPSQNCSGSNRPTERFAKVRRSVESGSDLTVAALTKLDPFLVEGVISDGERAAILDLWRKLRHPEDFARLTRLELDAEVVANTAKIIASYQKSMSSQSPRFASSSRATGFYSWTLLLTRPYRVVERFRLASAPDFVWRKRLAR